MTSEVIFFFLINLHNNTSNLISAKRTRAVATQLTVVQQTVIMLSGNFCLLHNRTFAIFRLYYVIWQSITLAHEADNV